MVRTALGMLTLAHGAVQRGELNEEHETDVRAASRLLMGEAMTFSMTFPDVPDASLDLVRRVGTEVADAVRDRADALMLGFMQAFITVAMAYEKDCPDADVAGILQRLALEADNPIKGDEA